MRAWSWNIATGIRILAHALVLAALCVAIAEGATDVPESCQSLAERYASAPDQATLVALQACLAAERPGALQVTASPSAPADQLPVEPWVRQPTRARGDWPAAEPWAHTSKSWPDNPW